MRSIAAALAWLVAVLATLVAAPTLWVATHVSDEDGYVAFTEPFATDPELRDALADGVAGSIVDTVTLPVDEAVLRELVGTAFERVVEQDGFPAAWAESQRRSHRLTFGPDRAEERLVVDIGPFLGLVGDQVTQAVGIPLDLPEQVVVPVGESVDQDLVDVVESSPGWSRVALVVAGIAAVLTLLLARRRTLALGWLGLGAAGVAGALMVANRVGVPELLDRTRAETPLATTMRDLLAARAVDSFEGWLVLLLTAGAVVALAGFVGRALTGR